MIERYTRPEMARIWSEKNKYDMWLQVELAVCEAWAQRGVIPKDALPKLRNARYDLDAIARYLPEMHHDMTVFLRSLSDSLGPESRYLHLGLTSQDVMDTGLALQLIEATELLERELRALAEAIREKALEHKDTLCIGRSHGVHAEPTTFGLKLAAWWDELRRQTHRLTQAKETVSVG
ncbi:MAG: lyase family protein, partial [Dehalococcoidia bacterium]